MVKFKFLHEEELAVNITSLIDVIFILLIFFMVSTQFKKSSLPLDLPKSENTTTEKDVTKTLAVTNDKIEFDGRILSIEELNTELLTLASANPESAISLECEKTVPFETVVTILTNLQSAGISRIGIVHEPLD